MIKVRYNPCNRNERSGQIRQSWPTAFDDMADRRRAERDNVSCGFHVKDGGKPE